MIENQIISNMKKTFKFPKALALSGILMALVSLSVNATEFDVEEVMVNGICYGIVGTTEPYKAFVVESYDWDEFESTYKGEITVPQTVEFEGGKVATVVGVDDYAFYSSDVTTVTLPNSVETIGKQAFALCSQLTCMKIGSGIREIMSKAFNPDAKLTTMYIDAVEPPVIATDALMNNPSAMTLYVPAGSVDKYKNADTWNKIGTIMTADEKVSVTEIIVTPSVANVSEMGTLQLSATVYPAEAQQKVAWTSSNTNVARVSGTGEVFGVKSGVCTITASATDGSGVKGECTLTVGSGKILQVNMPYISGFPGDEYKLKAEVSPAETLVEWSVADETIASLSVQDKEADVKLLAEGKTTIKVTASNGLSTEIEVNVKELIALTAIEVNPSVINCEVGDHISIWEFNVSPVPENVSVFNPDFRIEDTSIVDYDPDDYEMETFECLASGTTRFVWSQDGVEGYCTIVVAGEQVNLTGIVLDPEEIKGEYKAGDKIQITATPQPANATDFNPEWSSTDPEVATVDSNGLVTIVKPGDGAAIICKSGAIQAECPVSFLQSGVTDAVTDGHGYVVISVDGIVVKKCNDKKDLDSLPAGFYIVNGKKYFKGNRN